MKTIVSLLSCLFLLAPVWGQEESAKQLLRDGLFEEEANRDFKKAEEAYRKLIERYDAERRYAGTALFRLAEIAKKRGEKELAVSFYQRVAKEFADQVEIAARARTELGGMRRALPPSPNTNSGVTATTKRPVAGAEGEEYRRLQILRVESPDLLDGLDAEGQYPLHKAAAAGWSGVIDFLLEEKVNVNVRNSGLSATPLHLAVMHGHLKVVEKLLAAGAAVDEVFYEAVDKLPVPAPSGFPKECYGGWTALHLAALFGRREVAEALQKGGASTVGDDLKLEKLSIRTTPGGGWRCRATPLILAIWMGNEKMARFLIENGADPSHAVSADGNSPLITALRKTPALVPYLLEKGAKVTNERYLGMTALHYALERPESGLLKVLVEKGADIDAKLEGTQDDRNGLAALDLALRNAEVYEDGKLQLHTADVKFLLSHGAKPTPDSLGRVAKYGQIELVKLILDSGFDSNVVVDSETGDRALHVAKDVATAKLLLEHGAELEAKNYAGDTPLREVFSRGHLMDVVTALFDYLLDRGADPSALHLENNSKWRGFLPTLASHACERVLYPLRLGADRVMVAFPRKGELGVGDTRVIEGTAPPTVPELLAMHFLTNELSPTYQIRVRVLRGDGAKVNEVARLEPNELATVGDADIRWGDLVEFDFFLPAAGSAASTSVPVRPGSTGNQKLGALQMMARRCALRTITIRAGGYEEKVTVEFSEDSNGLLLQDHLSSYSRFLDLSKVSVTRGEAKPLVLDLRTGVENERLRLVDGDVVTIPMREGIDDFVPSKVSETPDGLELRGPRLLRWEGIVVFFPDRLGAEFPDSPETTLRLPGTMDLVKGFNQCPGGRDFSKMEIRRVTEKGLEIIPVDLVKLASDLPRYEWTRDKLRALGRNLADGDLVVVPPRDDVPWLDRNQVGYVSEPKVLVDALGFLRSGSRSGVRPTRLPAPPRSR